MLLVLPACTKKPYEAEWERPDSALDPVGLSAHKQDARDRAGQSKYKKGEKVTLRNSRTMLFEQNPETDYSVTGSPYSDDSAVVLEPGPLFLKVEMKSGTRGYINVSDIVDPDESSFGLLPMGTNVVLPAIPGGGEDMPAFLRVVEEMPGSSLEGGSGVLPGNAVPAKAIEAKPQALPVAPATVPAAVVTPAPAKPKAEVVPAAPAAKEASTPAKADESLPPSSTEAAGKGGK